MLEEVLEHELVAHPLAAAQHCPACCLAEQARVVEQAKSDQHEDAAQISLRHAAAHQRSAETMRQLLLLPPARCQVTGHLGKDAVVLAASYADSLLERTTALHADKLLRAEQVLELLCERANCPALAHSAGCLEHAAVARWHIHKTGQRGDAVCVAMAVGAPNGDLVNRFVLPGGGCLACTGFSHVGERY